MEPNNKVIIDVIFIIVTIIVVSITIIVIIRGSSST